MPAVRQWRGKFYDVDKVLEHRVSGSWKTHPHPLRETWTEGLIKSGFSLRTFAKGEVESAQSRSGVVGCHTLLYHYCPLDLGLQFPHPCNKVALPALKYNGFLWCLGPLFETVASGNTGMGCNEWKHPGFQIVGLQPGTASKREFAEDCKTLPWPCLCSQTCC